MKKYILPSENNYYKANLHCHSNWSDGFHSPQELKALYKEKGYSVLAVTDHEGLFYHKELDDEDFITLAGYELEFNCYNGDDWNIHTVACHLCCYKKNPSDMTQPGLDYNYTHPKFNWTFNSSMKALMKCKGEPFSKEHTIENINHVISVLKDEGFIVTYNHPAWSHEDYPTYTAYKNMDNLEIFNNGTYLMGYYQDSRVFDDLIRTGHKVFVTACDDNHNNINGDNPDMFGGFTVISAPSLSYENIITALENGNFYASTGPLLKEYYEEDGYLCITSETPLKCVRMMSDCRVVGYVAGKNGEPIYTARFAKSSDCIYQRIEAEDMSGGKLWLNPYYYR